VVLSLFLEEWKGKGKEGGKSSWGKINGESETEGIRDGGDRIGAIRGDRLVMSVPRSYHVSPRAVSHN